MGNSKIDKPKASKKKEITTIEDMPIVKLKKGIKTTKYKPTNDMKERVLISNPIARNSKTTPEEH